jgi:hypothetical protein
MGRGGVAITLDLYGHLLPGSHDDAKGGLGQFAQKSDL